MTVEAGDYPWSSYSIRMGAAKRQNWLDDNPLFEALGETEELRRKHYAEFVRQAISDEELSLIRDAEGKGDGRKRGQIYFYCSNFGSWQRRGPAVM